MQRTISSFCYPCGRYDTSHPALVERAGFTCARTVRRFDTDPPRRPLEAGTTAHTYRHLMDGPAITRLFGTSALPELFCNWDSLACALFDKVVERGGVFHLWGHSAELEAHHDWSRLERVLAHVAARSDVWYADNAAVGALCS